MPPLNLLTATQIDAERGAKEGGLDIMGDDGIAAEDHLYKPTANQVCDIAARSCMENSRAKHKENFAIVGSSCLHLACNFVDCQHFGFLGGNAALHKCE